MRRVSRQPPLALEGECRRSVRYAPSVRRRGHATVTERASRTRRTQKTRLAGCCGLAAAISLNHQLACPKRTLVNYCAEPGGINHLKLGRRGRQRWRFAATGRVMVTVSRRNVRPIEVTLTPATMRVCEPSSEWPVAFRLTFKAACAPAARVT